MEEKPRTFSIGLDIGQKVDHSAICVVEIIDNKVVVKALVKFPLGTPWDVQYDAITDVAKDLLTKGQIMSFNVDATGVGAIPADVLQQRLPEINVTAFKFTPDRKRELIGKVKVLHTLGKLKIATKKGDEIYNQVVRELITEMRYIQAKILREEGDKPQIEVFKTGAHDDLFTALALAVKDVDINMDWEQAGKLVQFAEDKTWVHTPLDDEPSQVIFF